MPKENTHKPDRPKLRSSHEGATKKSAKPSRGKKSSARASVRKPSRLPSLAPRSHEPAGRESSKAKKGIRPYEATSLASDGAREMAVLVAAAALDKKAMGLEILDVAGRVDYADFLILMTGRSDRHVIALAQGIEEAIRKQGKRPVAVEGLPHASWVLMDYGDIVVHVFQEGARGTYDLDGLWQDARRIPVPNDAPASAN